jgi:predicted aspartyl protease
VGQWKSVIRVTRRNFDGAAIVAAPRETYIGDMGLTHQRLIVKSSRNARKAIKVDFLIDSGAVYSLVLRKQLRSIGVKPYKTLDFSLADGSIVTREVGDAYYEFRGDGGAAPVIFGQDGDQPLLGATTLESLGLILNPFQRELKPMKLVLMRLAQS